MTQGKSSWIVTAIYILAGFTIILLMGTRDAFVQEKTNLIYVGRMKLGYQYSIYGFTQVVISMAILYNLQAGRKAKVGQPNPYFVAASILAVSTVGLWNSGPGVDPSHAKAHPGWFYCK